MSEPTRPPLPRQLGRPRTRLPSRSSLTEVVQAQADTTGFVVLDRWAEILERHFPPRRPDPDNVAE
ncbi:hypothetical protein [Streptomyces sp. NBC_01216]|uniref:hypothetical protein n=1 Tax=Streptomyces sp. NPDC048577 TaxID=3157209 RepID=UPI002E139BDF|nr:hypothetical protein OG393_00520 [Streptomyces sp. NBC_01216]